MLLDIAGARGIFVALFASDTRSSITAPAFGPYELRKAAPTIVQSRQYMQVPTSISCRGGFVLLTDFGYYDAILPLFPGYET